MKHRLLAIAISGALAAGAALAAETDDLATQARRMDSLAAGQGTTRVESRISADYTDLAGSSANSDALVTGLRNGTSITLTSTSTDAKGVATTTTTTFTPPTGKMGYGNVYTSLALAKYQLASLGITNPTSAQLEAALVGGTITLNGKQVPISGVLELRAQGMGWGQIAQQYGTKLGPVISGMRSANAQVGSQATANSAGAGKPSGTGVTTAAGGSAGQSHGQGNAYGRGITTAGGGAGPASTQGHGNAYGRGIVSGAGSAPGTSGAAAAGKGKAN